MIVRFTDNYQFKVRKNRERFVKNVNIQIVDTNYLEAME